MNEILVVLMMMIAGGMLGFQSPINTALSKRVGIFESALVSFSVGTVILLCLVLIIGKGNIREVLHAPLWEWTGGLLGVMFVTSTIVSVPRIGVSTAMVAAIAGQLLIGMIVDHFGWFGVANRPIDWQRVIGTCMMIVAVWMIFSGQKGIKQVKTEPQAVQTAVDELHPGK